MLSLGSRNDGRKGVGPGFRSRVGAMEGNELEEGEAFSGHADDACTDPDIALSYIDEKLQDVLGHFQKDFEGGVSAENLGAKFGGYGSFLPAYQRSPAILSQSRSPPRIPNSAVLKSPYNSSTENPSVPPRGSSASKNYTATLTQPIESSRKENCMSSLDAGGCASHLDSSNKRVNVSDQKPLKVRIKVGPDNTLARNNAAIYSGLGLDSPSSTPEDSPGDSPVHSSEFQGAPGESPLSILQVMTCFSVPGGYLLSPLHKNLFQLSENESLSSRKASFLGKCAPEMCPVSNVTLSTRDMKGFIDENNMSDAKTSISTEEENLKCKGDTSKMLKKVTCIEAPASKMGISNDWTTPLQPCSRNTDLKTECQITGDAVKDSSRALAIPKELSKFSVKDKFPFPDSSKDDQCISMGSMKSVGSDVGNIIINSKGRLNYKTTLLEKAIEKKNPSNQRDISSDNQREGKFNNKKGHDLSKLIGDDYKGRNHHVATDDEPVKQMPACKVSSHEKDAEKILQGNDQLHESKRRHKGSHNNYVPSVESVQRQGDLMASSSPIQNQKNKNSHARGDHSGKKSKVSKSRKGTSGGYSIELQRDAVKNINAQRVENRADVHEPIISTEKPMDRSGAKKENIQLEPLENATANTSFMTATSAADAAAPLDDPLMVIKDNWVCCDRCQKWRLLPYGTDPNHLPTKWKCSMQVWLPGLNKCSVSEEESKEAFNALYLVPAHVIGANLNGHHVASGINSSGAGLDHGIPSVPTTEKKMSGLISASNVSKNSVSKKNIQASVKSRSLSAVDENTSETNSSIKTGVGLIGKSTDVSTYKHIHKEKHETPGRFSDGGDLVVKSGKHSKSKSKREINQDGHQSYKKIKKGDSDYLVEDQLSDLDLIGKAAPDMDNGLLANVKGNILLNCSDHSSSKDSKSELRGILSSCNKKSNDPIHSYSNGDFKDHYRGFDADKFGMLDYTAKKRKVNEEWQESRTHSETVVNPQKDSRFNAKEAFSEGEPRKQKKAKVSKYGGKESSVSNGDGKTDKKGWATRILLSGRKEQRSDGLGEEGRVGGKEYMGYQETRQALDGNDPLKRDMTCGELPTAATSSSSKVSGSRKSKANLQEARGSPVESVSSSPLRTSTIKKTSIRRNSAVKDMVNLDSLFMGSPKRCSDGELGSDQSGTLRKETGVSVKLKSLESNRVAESGVLGSIGGACRYLEKEARHLPGGNTKDGLYSTRGALTDLSPAEFVGTNAVGGDKYLCDGQQKDDNHDDSGNLNYHRNSNGNSQRKPDKSSFSLKEKNRRADSNANGGKIKLSNHVSDKNELYSIKNVSNDQSEADFICNDNSDHHQDLRDENCNLQEKDVDCLGKKSSSAKRSRFDKRNDHSNYGSEENLDGPKKDLNSRVSLVGTSCKSSLQKNIQQAPYPGENPQGHSLLDCIDRSNMAPGEGMPQPVQPLKDNLEAHNSGQVVHTHIKGSKSDAYPIDTANGDTFKVAKLSREPDNQNVVHSSNLRQATPNGRESSPARKDGPSVPNVVLKEARDLKHTANRLKNEGLFQESIGLYFQAALKFLYGAYLLEPSGAESAKHGEMNPSMQMISMYSDTARLCEYCAHEYERHKEMAAAALAYKCVEVAYMKVAHYKHSGANKDRHELLTALQTVLPGESPSSSASDVDNLNNQGVLDKVALAKAACSPQITGNHVIAARNRPNFMRLLSYTNDLNCAFEATKKSQTAIATANVSLEKDGIDGMSSVREVLDFNFHNVEGLLRLVRLSIESISL